VDPFGPAPLLAWACYRLDMTPCFRWFGEIDRVPLAWIAQMTPTPLVVTHLPHFVPGEIWTLEALRTLKTSLDRYGLELGPIESLFWTDAMKLGLPARDEHIANYVQSMRNIRAVFPREAYPHLNITYNLMPLDWGRTSLARNHASGVRGLAFDQAELDRLDLSNGLFLPGWGKPYTAGEYRALLEGYTSIGVEGFWKNVEYALRAIVPHAQALHLPLAAHPSDPPWPTLGLPALLVDLESARRLLSLVDSPFNGLCFCTGSYGSNPANDVVTSLRDLSGRVVWLHLRATRTLGPQHFIEVDHADPHADVDLVEIVRSIAELGMNLPFRSDHGLDLFYETDLEMRGYPAIGRYAGNQYLLGLWRGFTHPSAPQGRPTGSRP
jgi:mannonate dehydratase